MPAKPKVTKYGLVGAPVHVEGITYQQRFITCGKERCRKGCRRGVPSHGPYWYAFAWIKGKARSYYVGKVLPRLEMLADRPERIER